MLGQATCAVLGPKNKPAEEILPSIPAEPAGEARRAVLGPKNRLAEEMLSSIFYASGSWPAPLSRRGEVPRPTSRHPHPQP